MAVPLILSTGSWSLQGFINRMFLVWHSPESLAAAMPGRHGQLRDPQPLHRHGGIREHVRGPVPRRGPGRKVGGILWQSVPVALFAGLVNLALIPAAPIFFGWVGHVRAVQAEEVTLFRILCLGATPVVMASAFSGMLSGLGRTRPVMVDHPRRARASTSSWTTS